MVHLGINVDHVATIRQARRGDEPDPIFAASIAETAGADVITIHLREDRRHIQDRDARLMRETCKLIYNLEISCAPSIIDIACQIVPDQATLVPEKREEVTTEGGLDLLSEPDRVRAAVDRLHESGVKVSLFLDPEEAQIDAAAKLGVAAVELHTGRYALTKNNEQIAELERLTASAQQIRELGMLLHAGHGLNYQNVGPIAAISGMKELNIGHSIISRAVFTGLAEAVRDMKRLIVQASQ